MTAKRARKAWNGGLVGQSAPGREIARPAKVPCGAPRCGEATTKAGRSPTGMTRVLGAHGEPSRIYCAGWCATYAQALADVRTLR